MGLQSLGQWFFKELGDPPEMCGPNDLAERALRQRYGPDQRFRFDRWDLSDENFKRLINLVYYASMRPDEGRFPRFTTILRPEGRFWIKAQFIESVSLDLDSLRRLAPSCVERDDAIWVAEENNNLVCKGLVPLDPTVTAREGLSGARQDHGLSFTIRARGPGHLELASLWESLELRAGQIRSMRGAWNPIKGLPARLEQIATEVVKGRPGLLVHLRPGFETLSAPNHILGSFGFALSRVLGRTIRRGHGGCLVILPDGVRIEGCINLKYRTSEVSLSDAAANFWYACAGPDPFPETPEEYGQEREEKAKLLATIDLIDRASCMDGCVVLDGRLNLLGFGGEITIPEADLGVGQRPLFDEDDQPLPTEAALRLVGGTRHRSALRLCMKVEGAICFVVSQDGDLTVFVSSADRTDGYKDVGVEER